MLVSKLHVRGDTAKGHKIDNMESERRSHILILEYMPFALTYLSYDSNNLLDYIVYCFSV